MTTQRPADRSASIAGATVVDSAAQVVVMLFSIATGILLARRLGDEGRGHYIFATSFAGLLVLSLANMGVETACAALVGKDRGRLRRVHGALTLVSLGAGLVFALACLAARGFISRWLLPGIEARTLLLLGAALPFWIYFYGGCGLLVGLGRARRRSLLDLASNVVQNVFVVLVLCLYTMEDETGQVHLLVAGFYAIIVAAALAVPFLLGGGWSLPDRAALADLLRTGFWIHAGNMGTNLGQRADLWCAQQAGGGALFGVYSLAAGLVQRTRVFPQALQRASYARVCSGTPAEAARLVASCTRQMVVLGILLLAAGAACSPLIPLVYTSEFAGAALPFVILLGGRLAQNVAWLIPGWYTGQAGRPEVPMRVNWALLPVQAGLAWMAMRTGSLAWLAAAASAGCILQLAVFSVLFVRTQPHVGWRGLLVPTPADIARWRVFARRAAPMPADDEDAAPG